MTPGVVPSPIGHAHVISFTTHKTLYGPRGACILTTDKKLAAKVDSAVFPGEQGGPHVNAIAGMAVAFPIGVGLALVAGVVMTYIQNPIGHAGLLFLGVAGISIAIVLDAVAYRMIAKVEAEHERRYLKLLQNISEDQVFVKDGKVWWKCQNCGYTF